jgi:hypothetical protein
LKGEIEWKHDKCQDPCEKIKFTEELVRKSNYSFNTAAPEIKKFILRLSHQKDVGRDGYQGLETK